MHSQPALFTRMSILAVLVLVDPEAGLEKAEIVSLTMSSGDSSWRRSARMPTAAEPLLSSLMLAISSFVAASLLGEVNVMAT